MDLNDRVVLVTGGKRIGAVVAADLARRGAHVALSYNRSRDEAEAAAEAVRAAGRRALVVQADLAADAACEALVQRVVHELGGLDILVHMASIYDAVPLASLTTDHVRRCVDVEVHSALALALAALPHMRSRGGGRIVTFSDWLAVSGRPRYKGYLGYYVAKRGVMGLTEALALELAGDRILVNAVAPGPILAPEGISPDEVQAVEKATPLGRWGGAEEIAKAVAALVESDFVTGQTVRVDGGRHIR
jgi:NAD(P)-dependent dehydrogenase (short-subunit alcohol dehydrogenase family)